MEKMQFNLNRPWDEVKEYLKESNTGLTDEDLSFEPGQEDQLLERLSQKMKMSKEQVKGVIESASHSKGIAG